jgi:outer membrane receptor protein involved in Fe transport
MGRSRNGFAAVLGHICSVASSPRCISSGGTRRGGSRARDCHRLEHSNGGRNRTEPGGYVSAADMEKLGIRNATDLQTFLPQEAGGTVNLNIANGGDGTVQLNLRGFLPKETLVLVDGKRVAYGSLGVAGFSQGEDINLIPFPMIDHIDILKDGASAVYGSDAVAGVVNFFLIHKFRGVEIGAAMGTQTWEPPMRWASGRRGLKRARAMIRRTLWSLPISGSGPVAFSAATGTFPVTPFKFPGVGSMSAAETPPATFPLSVSA